MNRESLRATVKIVFVYTSDTHCTSSQFNYPLKFIILSSPLFLNVWKLFMAIFSRWQMFIKFCLQRRGYASELIFAPVQFVAPVTPQLTKQQGQYPLWMWYHNLCHCAQWPLNWPWCHDDCNYRIVMHEGPCNFGGCRGGILWRLPWQKVDMSYEERVTS